MTKQELMENYTMEQLADMVVQLEAIIDDKLGGWSKRGISYNDFFSMRDEIDCLRKEAKRKEIEINQIDYILEKLFGLTHDIAKPDEFEKILKEKIAGIKTLADFLPAEPIKIADILINSFFEPKSIDENGTELVFYKRKFNISELRQIAEHLLVYCNANGDKNVNNKKFEKPNCNKCFYMHNCPCGNDCCNAACLTMYKPAENNHKLGLKFPKISKCCMGIDVYIDRERINAIGLYPLDRDRISDAEEFDLEFNIAELEVRDIEDIALLMNKETFEKFCELWRMHHNI